ncbi:hypothetical protein ACFL50_00455 [Candidatus Latescibacterota bacterium]
MARIFRTLGRLTGYALRSQVVDKALYKTADFLKTEIKLADVKLKLKLLQKKRTHHLKLLGKTVYRLHLNEIELIDNSQTHTISRVLREIDMEIEDANEQLEIKKRQEQEKKKKSAHSHGPK